MEVLGELKVRVRGLLPDLPTWSHPDVLSNSMVVVLVNASGNTISARLLLPGSGLKAADDFALQAARIVREKAIEQLVDGIQYLKDGSWYDMTEWVEEEETVSERLIPVENSIYDHIVVQSDTEKRFVEKLKKRTDVRLFVKLPGWFKVATPVGQYNPDWGLVMEEVDAFGDHGPLLYLVRETKSTTVASELRGTENQKNHCGERHQNGCAHRGHPRAACAGHIGKRSSLWPLRVDTVGQGENQIRQGSC